MYVNVCMCILAAAVGNRHEEVTSGQLRVMQLLLGERGVMSTADDPDVEIRFQRSATFNQGKATQSTTAGEVSWR